METTTTNVRSTMDAKADKSVTNVDDNEASASMTVIKRDGSIEPLLPQKMLNRLRNVLASSISNDSYEQRLCRIVNRVVSGLPTRVKTSDIDDQLAACTANLAIEHPDYGRLSSSIALDNYCRNVPQNFHEYLEIAHTEDLICDELYRLCLANMRQLMKILNSVRRIDLSFCGLRTLQNGYLLRRRHGGQCFEHPKFMYLRIALQLFQNDMNNVYRFFRCLCTNYVTVASPIIFSSGSAKHSLQMASCFVLPVEDDSIDGMYATLRKQALLMKNLGGIGLSVSNVRCRGSSVHGFNGKASGVVNFLRVINSSCQHISQGGGKRAGALAAYLEPWHGEILDFLKMRRVDGPEEMKARQIFYGLWIPDEFMRRVRDDREWSLMCPHNSPGLDAVYGREFDELYRSYETQGKYLRRLPARELLAEIVKSMIEMGNPYVMFKDHVNVKSNQQNIGIIRGSNLCSEICLHFDRNEIAVCVLGAIVLHRAVCDVNNFNVKHPERNGPSFRQSVIHTIQAEVARTLTAWQPAEQVFNDDAFRQVSFPYDFFSTSRAPTLYYDFSSLRAMTKLMVRALDNMIDLNNYALDEARRSNEMNRPLGIGVQGLANLFVRLKLPFASPEARLLNRLIFEHMYAAAVEASIELAIERGPYPRFHGSPMSRGCLQPHMWNAHFVTQGDIIDWSSLVERVKLHGLRNSTLTAIMPTATTAQLWNNNESVEPLPSVFFYRRLLSGQFVVVNSHLMDELSQLGIWDSVYEDIVRAQGSIQQIERIPADIRELYKTAWEIPQKVLLDLSADRAPFIDQSQSMNIWMAEPTMQKLSALLMYAWRKGLKTASYYLRTKPAFYASRTVLGEQTEQRVRSSSDDDHDDDDHHHDGGERLQKQSVCPLLGRRPADNAENADNDDKVDCIACSL